MAALKIEQSFELKLNRSKSISNYNKFLEAVPKFKRWFLITFHYSNGNLKKSIITLNNPKKELKNHLLNEDKFFLYINKNFKENSLKKVQIQICKS